MSLQSVTDTSNAPCSIIAIVFMAVCSHNCLLLRML